MHELPLEHDCSLMKCIFAFELSTIKVASSVIGKINKVLSTWRIVRADELLKKVGCKGWIDFNLISAL